MQMPSTIYNRVARALTAAGEELCHPNHFHCARVAESLNREFELLGVRIVPEDLRVRRSVAEIAEVITEKAPHRCAGASEAARGGCDSN